MEKKKLANEWISRWYGSAPYKGWTILCGRDEVAYLGENVSSEAVEAIVMAHNEAVGH